MKTAALIRQLDTLVDLREREVDRLSVEMAEKQALQKRFRANLARLQGLCSDAAPLGAQTMALAINRAGYKQDLLRLVDQHRQDLALHESGMAVTQRALVAAAQRCEVLGQVRAGQQRRRQAELGRRDQKQQDELATQVWWRGRSS